MQPCQIRVPLAGRNILLILNRDCDSSWWLFVRSVTSCASEGRLEAKSCVGLGERLSDGAGEPSNKLYAPPAGVSCFPECGNGCGCRPELVLPLPPAEVYFLTALAPLSTDGPAHGQHRLFEK